MPPSSRQNASSKKTFCVDSADSQPHLSSAGLILNFVIAAPFKQQPITTDTSLQLRDRQARVYQKRSAGVNRFFQFLPVNLVGTFPRFKTSFPLKMPTTIATTQNLLIGWRACTI